MRDWTVGRSDDPFREQSWRREIIEHLIFDRAFLRRCGDRLRPEDFEAGDGAGDNFGMILAKLALDYWRLHRTPVANSLGVELSKWARRSGVGSAKREEIASIIRRLRKEYRPDRSTVLQEEVREFQGRAVRARALRELAALDQSGELTADRWMEVTRQVMEEREEGIVRDFVEGIGARHARRTAARFDRIPVTMIEPLDLLVKSIGRGELGLAVAPPKRGKSLFLIWLAVIYAWQGLNVLFVTLEDPADAVEDRMDACISGIKVGLLREKSHKVRKVVQSWGDLLQTKIRIFDGTVGGTTVHAIEAAWERERAAGFQPDVVLIDYDDEIKPARRADGRRFEFADIYRDLRQFASRADVILWTAAQTVREAGAKDLIQDTDTAEDYSKVRKSTLVLGLGACKAWNGNSEGKGDAKTLHVIFHRNDRMRVWCRIWSDPSRGLFYDEDKTAEWADRDEETATESVE